jgi:hypothetical protein
VTPWGDQTILETWFWKDDLHIEKQLFYGLLWGAGRPVFVSLELLPALIAAQGDIDPLDLYERGRLSHTARTLYQHIEQFGPTPKNKLPYPPNTSQTPPLVQLQQQFLLTKVGLTGRTRGTYGYLWGRCDAFLPEAFEAAGKLGVAKARESIAAKLNLPIKTLAKGLRWPELR